jgi:hypothetical protein
LHQHAAAQAALFSVGKDDAGTEESSTAADEIGIEP